MADREFANTSVIILLDGKGSVGNGFVRKWLAKSRFSIVEVSDVFQALEEVSDFTIRCRPDIILMESGSLSEDFPLVKNVFQTASFSAPRCPIFVLSDSGEITGEEECFPVNLNQLKEKLDELIPEISYARAVA